jgi:hypothetical protein
MLDAVFLRAREMIKISDVSEDVGNLP